jgi:5-methylcytosine-specific restriction endonuclease McrA
MKNHIKVYLNHFDYKAERFEDIYIPCEICGGSAVDIHHIEPRQRGGSKKKDYVENLMALCRNCHNMAEAKRYTKEYLKAKHQSNLDFIK